MRKVFASKYLTKTNIIGFTISLIAAYFLFPPYFDMGIFPVQPSEHLWMSLDPSWISGLNYVNIHHLTWGKDFAFTYGPLSYLSTRVGWGQSKYSLLLFDLFYFVNFLSIFFLTFKMSKEKIVTGFLIAAISIILPHYFGAANAFVLLAFLLFWIRYSLDQNHPIIYLFQIAILVLLFYIKFNTGLISFILFTGAIIYKFLAKKEKRLFLLGYLLAPFVLIYFSSYLFNVELSSYISSAFEIVSGFNDIMYLPRGFGDRHVFALLILIFSGILLFYKVFKNQEQTLLKKLFIIFIFSISAYVLFKQAFVRADEGHILEFYNYVLLLVFSVYDFHIQKSKFYLKGLLILNVIIAAYYVKKLDANPFNFEVKLNKPGYVEGFKSFTDTSSVHLFPNNNQLPQNIKDKVGNNTIDIYPWNTQLLLENKFNFTPRPVFQSYTAYTPKLEEKNFDHYNSEKAPKYVLYDFGSVDNRYPLFDESKLNLLLSMKYSCVDTLTHNNRLMLLLEKTNQKRIKLVQTKEYALMIDSPLIPKEGIYYEVFLYRNLPGDFISLVNHAPEIYLSIFTKDGKYNNFKSSKGLLETGVFGNQFITDTRGFKNFMEKKVNDSNTVSAYYFRPYTPSLFKDKIRIKEYKIIQE
jgi:hypothetical protein